jgi:hypothetical protein
MRLLIDDTEQPVIMTCSSSCTFVFELGGLNKIEQKKVLPQWPRRKEYDLVSERIIQKYFEARDYKVEVLVYPFSLMNWPFPSLIRLKEPRHERGITSRSVGRTVYFAVPHTNAEPVSDFMHYMNDIQDYLTVMGPGMQGRLSINVGLIYASVKFFKEAIACIDDSHLSIKQVAQHFWPWASKNLKGTIHNWIQGIPYKNRARIPVFRPEIHARKTDRKGCRLSVSDITKLGLLAGLFAHGVKSYDFEGPMEFIEITPEEIRDFVNAMFTEVFPGIGFYISKRVKRSP